MIMEPAQTGWDWEKASDVSPWLIPDPEITNLLHLFKDQSELKMFDLGCGFGTPHGFFCIPRMGGFSERYCRISGKCNPTMVRTRKFAGIS